MTIPQMLIPQTPPRAARALRRSAALVLIGLLAAPVACSDNTGDDEIAPSRNGVNGNSPTRVTRDDPANDGTSEGAPNVSGVDRTSGNAADESGIDDEDEIVGRSGGTRSGGGGGGRRRSSRDSDDELLLDGGVVDAGDAGNVDAGAADGGVVEDAGVVDVDAGQADAG